MKYMLLIYGTENRWTNAERLECMAESLGVCDDLKVRGKFIDAAPLQSVTTAKTLRVKDGRPFVTAGPFAETVEQLGGYYVLELDDLDEAIAVAAKLPPVHKGTVEIRPMQTLEGLPPGKPHNVEPGSVPYLFLIYQDEAASAKSAEEKQKSKAAVVALTREWAEKGTYLSASPLHPAETATCVRVREGKRILTDGPFAETNEVLGGYYLLRAGSQDEALRLASQLTSGCGSTIEVRQLFDLTGVEQARTNS